MTNQSISVIRKNLTFFQITLIVSLCFDQINVLDVIAIIRSYDKKPRYAVNNDHQTFL